MGLPASKWCRLRPAAVARILRVCYGAPGDDGQETAEPRTAHTRAPGAGARTRRAVVGDRPRHVPRAGPRRRACSCGIAATRPDLHARTGVRRPGAAARAGAATAVHAARDLRR